MRPTGLLAAARQLVSLCGQRSDVIIHGFGLHGMAVLAVARMMNLRSPRIVSITGLGYLMTLTGLKRLLASALVRLIAFPLKSRKTAWIAENRHDIAALGLASEKRRGRVIEVMGAGIDLARWPYAPVVRRGPLKLLFVSRMIWSKGVDLAVKALEEARRSGIDATLTIVGGPDPGNPKSYTSAQLADFGQVSGVSMLGPRADIATLHAEHDVFVLPSRGGEGLPKALLEAAAAARPAIVTDVPGCADFVVNGRTGWVVPANDTKALADAIAEAVRSDIASLGLAARRKVEASGGAAYVASRVVSLYRSLRGIEA